MASPAKVLCFFLLFFYISSQQIHARANQFFSKVSPYNANTNTKTVEETEVPLKENEAPKQEEEPTSTLENHNGYGLYGREMDQGAQFTYSNNPEKASTQEYNGGENSEYMLNNGNPYNSNNKGYETKQYGLSDTRYQDNGNDNYFGYENKQNSLNGNNKFRYPAQQQGMSDTRFLENGKYFYDLNNEELYQNRYQTARRRNDDFGSSSSRGVNSRNQYNQEGNDENLYRFNNFMENKQESREEYVP